MVRVGRSRGLLALPAVLVAVVVSLLGGALDEATGRGFGLIFSVSFAVGCVLAALLVRRDSLLPVVATPPLLYAALALGAGLARGLRTPRLQGLELFTALLVGAPTLVGTTVLVMLIALVRRLVRR